MEDLIERFRERFGTGDNCQPEAMKEFWERCQGPDEPTGKYMEDKARLAQRMRMRNDQFTLHDTIQGMRDDIRRDVLIQRPTTLEELQKAAEVAHASTPYRGRRTTMSGQLAERAVIIAQLICGRNRTPKDAGVTADATATISAGHTTAATSTTLPAGPTRTDDCTINIRVVMPDCFGQRADDDHATGHGRGFGPRRGRAHSRRGGWNGRPAPTTFPRQLRTDATQPPSATACQNCGYEHDVDNCAYVACYNCMNVGHFSRCCPTRGAPAPSQ